ncbi:hypothetical protein [Bradyrhizobium sp. 613_E4_N2_2]|uniref:hypothetical protein n=1 Tax=Bradyrhizobium sp. 613_E4_N2_2 TaxID=3240371 RepID=UPI003F89BF34
MNTPRIRNTSHQSMPAFYASRERMVHVSVWFTKTPMGLINGQVPSSISTTVRHHDTFNIGRNKAKRIARANGLRHIGQHRFS